MPPIRFIACLAGGITLSGAGPVPATTADADLSARAGTFVCGGNYRSPDVSALWTIRNISASRVLHLKRMRLYAASGRLIYDSRQSEAPPAFTNVDFGDLQPHQTVQLRTQELGNAGLLPRFLESGERPLQAVFDWESRSGEPMRIPLAIYTRVGPGGTRHALSCRTIEIKQ
ncbi:hypothetical protein [Thiohalorhabdus methylotrophus]|uniref:Uncharacterized protein n=1 Tax=Thiohalorhabdus methylotrophus TaxID=3242694 RepID=A0ABV4TSN6_9GAMM